ncbi:MAG: 50S ribosomal protein L5 [Candidatus Niyogibacteria bacterium]|nr:50S ribosomal protein L5 [Candidatus Niyogibacteria bacterium]
MASSLLHHYRTVVIPQLKRELGVTSERAVPRLVKIAVNTGIGRRDEKEREAIASQLELIVGQKVVPKKARKSIAAFKTRAGLIIGLGVTLRRARMYDFLERLIRVAIPRLRDFRGIDPKVVDKQGNLTLGFKEHSVFPEMIGEDAKPSFGLEVTLVTNARSRDDAIAFWRAIGIPFKK